MGRKIFCAFAIGMAVNFNLANAEPISPDGQTFQAILHKRLDAGSPYIIIPLISGGDLERKFAHSLLDELWTKDSYRTHLTNWLASQPAVEEGKLVGMWYAHYHKAFVDSFDLLKDNTVKKLWRLNDQNAVYALSRADCDSRSGEDIGNMLLVARNDFLGAHSRGISADLATAIAGEFSRQDNPKSGDRPVASVMSALTVRTLKAVAATLPDKDGEQLVNAYSYRPDAPTLSEAAMCQRGWIVAHAVEDSALSDSGVSSSIMRRTMTATAYSTAFRVLYKGQK
ncbi:hypothetical protein SAMN05192549_111151 [Duganella sacchari]|uniref:Uncharacterized protein n=1 Tax=Duganella sacchari TaxID=551987 RepID=A0A1M7R6B9_9BURK|nr:hypothetical protein [Duganella sacchari]SHN41029.1 hypothetical protein SAMN05192549_111151 [Duganella sacchari]